MKGTRILIIDDDPSMRRMIGRVLTGDGLIPVEADGGKIGLEMFKGGGFAVVIVDLLMPIQDGIETIRMIRAVDAGVPILATSGSGTGAYDPLDVAKRLGADRSLGKPFTVAALSEAVKSLLEREPQPLPS